MLSQEKLRSYSEERERFLPYPLEEVRTDPLLGTLTPEAPEALLRWCSTFAAHGTFLPKQLGGVLRQHAQRREVGFLQEEDPTLITSAPAVCYHLRVVLYTYWLALADSHKGTFSEWLAQLSPPDLTILEEFYRDSEIRRDALTQRKEFLTVWRGYLLIASRLGEAVLFPHLQKTAALSHEEAKEAFSGLFYLGEEGLSLYQAWRAQPLAQASWEEASSIAEWLHEGGVETLRPTWEGNFEERYCNAYGFTPTDEVIEDEWEKAWRNEMADEETALLCNATRESLLRYHILAAYRRQGVPPLAHYNKPSPLLAFRLDSYDAPYDVFRLPLPTLLQEEVTCEILRLLGEERGVAFLQEVWAFKGKVTSLREWLPLLAEEGKQLRELTSYGPFYWWAPLVSEGAASEKR